MNEEFSGPPLCIAGNINRDVKVQGVPESPGLWRDGETSVAGIGETMGGANSACVAATRGADVRLVGKVGVDALAERLRQALQRHGVRRPVHPAKAAPVQPSGVSSWKAGGP